MGATLSLATSNLFAFPVAFYCFYFNYFSSIFGKMKADLKKYSSSNDSPQTSHHFDPASLSKCSYGNSADIYNLAESTLNETMISPYIQKNGLTPGHNGISYHNDKLTGIRPNYCYTPEIKEAPPNAANMVKTQKGYNYPKVPDRAVSSNNSRPSTILERLIQNIAETVRSYSWWQSGYVHENPYSLNSTFVNQSRCPRERVPYTYPADSSNRLEKMASMYTTNPPNYMPTYDNPRCPPRRLSRGPSLFAKTHWFRESTNDKPPKAHVMESTPLDPSPAVENPSHSFLEPDLPLTIPPVCSSEEKQNSQSPSICTQHPKTNGPHHQQEEIMISESGVSPTNYDVVFFQSHGVLPGDPAVNTCQILNDLPRENVQNGILEIDDVVLTDCSMMAYSFSEESEDGEFCDDADSEDELVLFSENEDDEDPDSDYLDRCPSPLPPFKNHDSSPCKLESTCSDDDDDDDDDSSSCSDLEVDCCASLPHEGQPVIKRPDSSCHPLLTNNKILISPDDFNAGSQDEEDDDDDEIDEDEWENTWSRTSPREVNTCDRFFNPFFSATLIVSSRRTCVLGSPVPSSADGDVTPCGDKEQLNCANKILQNLKDANKRWNEAYNCDDDHHGLCSQNKTKNNHRKVTFATGKNLQTRHLLICWSFAYQSARKGPWMNLSLDTKRFHDRIDKLKSIIDPVLDPGHRQKIFNLQVEKEST